MSIRRCENRNVGKEQTIKQLRNDGFLVCFFGIFVFCFFIFSFFYLGLFQKDLNT